MKNIPGKVHLFIQIAALTILVFLLAWATISSHTYISNDVGLRFLQIRELIAHQWQTFAVDYPAQYLDPDLQFTPYYYAYSLIDGQIYLNISHFFPLLASFLYHLLGTVGLTILPVSGGVLTAVAAFKIGTLAQIRYPRLLMWATIFSTPIIIYSMELWDHSVAAACATWAVYGVSRGIINGRWAPLVWGGIAAGLGLGQRPEMYVFAIVLGAALIITTWPQWQKWLAFIAGGITATLPIWFLQYRWVGHPFGMAFAPHFSGYGRPDSYPVQSYSGITITPAIKISRFLFYIQSHDFLTFAATLLLVLGIFSFIFSLRIPAWRTSKWLWGSLLLTTIGFLLFYSQAWHTLLPGILTTFPLAVFALAYVNQSDDASATRPIYQLTWLTTTAFIGIMLIFWPAYGGEQWGARYLLPAYPLLLFIAFYSYTIRQQNEKRMYAKTMHVLFFSLLGLGFILQSLGARLLFISHTNSEETRNAVAELPAELILTNNPFFPSAMASLDTKLFMYVANEQAISDLIPRLVQHNINHFALITVEGMPLNVPKSVGNIVINQTATLIYEIEPGEP